MKITEKRLVDTVVDCVCDVCNQSLMLEINGENYDECAELTASWGYGSKQDGKSYHLDLCESCFMVALYALRDERRSHVMFDEDKDLSDENFGLDLSRSSY
jgi:hypothetical protein